MINEYRELEKRLYRDEKKHWVSMTEEERNIFKRCFVRGIEYISVILISKHLKGLTD